jgi:putative tryptophan/tyrosine transport system substrate-binding protein
MGSKRLELLKEVVAHLARVAVLYNPANPSHVLDPAGFDTVALKIGANLQWVALPHANALEHAFAEITKGLPDALLIFSDASTTAVQRRPIADFAVRRRLPTMALYRNFVEAGALMCYGASLSGQLRQAASYVDKILKGRKPADLPVERATQFELVINLKTAKALGLTIPQSLLLQATEVIE